MDGGNGSGGTLTLNGAAGSAFVLNISGAFNLGGNAKILLTGGLTVSDVLFNITGSNSTFSIGGEALFNGTLLAYNSSGTQRTLQITGHNTQINGELLAYKISLQSGAHVKKPKEKSKEKDDDVVASNSLLRARTSAKNRYSAARTGESRIHFRNFAPLRNSGVIAWVKLR